jgi:hypothetical protein
MMRRSRRLVIRRFLGLILITVGVLMVLGTVLLNLSGMGGDLLLNLVAEILVLVLAFDQIPKLWERRRWAPVNRRVIARLTEYMTELLPVLAPDEFRGATLRSYRYEHKYGDIDAVLISTTLLETGNGVELPERVKAYVANQAGFDTAHLAQVETRVTSAIDRWSFLLDPEPLCLLLDLERSLVLANTLLSSTSWTDQRSRDDAASALGWVASSAVKVWFWLRHLLDEHFAFQGEDKG